MRCIRILFTAIFLLASVVLLSTSAYARPVIPAADPPPATCNLKLETCNSQPAIRDLQSDKCELLDDPNAHLSGALESMLRLHCGRVDLSGVDRLGGNEPRESRIPVQANDVLVNEPAMDTGDSTTQSEVSLAVRPSDGRLCAVWNDSSDYLTTGSFNGFAYSDDGGLTWHDQGPLPTRGSGYVENWGDPGIKVDGDGTFYYSTMVATWGGSVGVGVARSDDGCQSFSAPVVAHAGSDVDKPLMTVDAHPGSPYVDNIYVAWVDFGAGERPYFSRSTDGGAAWSAALNLCPGCWGGQQAPILSTAPDGDLYVAWLNYTGAGAHDRSISVVRSADGGVSFGDPVRVVNFNRSYEPGATSSCNRDALNGDVRYADFPSLDITSDGVLHILYSADPDATGSGDAADVYYTRSLDDGLTWSSPVRINDDVGLNDQFFPTIEANPTAEDSANFLTAYWYDRRADVHNLEYEIYKAFSYNGGRSWSENVLVSDEPSPIPTINPNFDPIVATCYMADYNLGDSDDDYVYLTWSDNRLVQNGHPDPDVWFEKEPLPEAPPSISLAPEYLSAQGCPGATLRRTLTLTNELGFEETFTLTAVISDPVAAPWLSVQPIPPTIRLSDGERGSFEAVAQIMAPAPPNAAAWVTVTAVAQSDPFYFDDAGVEVRVSPAEDFGLVLRKAIQGDHGESGRATTVGAGLRARLLRQGDHGGSPLQFALPGQPLTYTLALTNTGLCTLTQVVISDVIPSLVVTDAVASDILITDTHANPPYVWDLENLSPGAGGLITISGFISLSLVTDTIILNEARISALPDLTSTNQSAQASVSVEVPRVYFSHTLYSALESATVAPIAVRLNVPNPYADVGVDYAVLRDGGSATGGSDYVVASGTLTIPAGNLSAAFDVTILDDALDEVDESVLLQLRDPRSSCPYNPMAATLFIIDDDMGSVAVDPISLTVSEPSGSAAFTLTLGSAPTAPVAIDFSASNDECRPSVTGTATPVVTLTHDNWDSGLGVRVVAVDDALHDGDQTCIIQTAASRSDDPDYDGLDPPDVTVTVRDDDLPPLAEFTLNAQPTSLLADGVSTSTLTVTAVDVTGDGAPFAGRVITFSWTIPGGGVSSATTVTLDAAGVATYTYTAYTSTGTVVFTATLMDYGAPQVATTTIQLKDNPLRGELTWAQASVEMRTLITYTFVVSNVHPLDSHFNLVMTGSVPANCRLVQSQRLNQSSNAQGYVEARLPELLAGESYTLSWTVEPVLMVGDIEAQAHAVSDSAARRLTLWSHIYRLLLLPVFRNFDF